MENLTRLLLQDVNYTYPDGTRAISNVSLGVAAGDFIGILGYNGSGKTTLLNVMDGLNKDFQGTVLLDGADIRGLSPKEIYKKMGIVFQNPDDQLFASTVREDVAFGPINMGFSKKEVARRVAAALKDINMEDSSGKPIHHLSFGQKKKICIAGLLSMGHEILLLDEPTAGLDPLGEYQMMSLLTRLNKEKGVTIVIATHSVDLVPLFINRLFVLSAGEIARSGTPESVFTAPEDMKGIRLRMPHIAELMYRLKHEDQLPFQNIPLTIGEARQEMLRLFEDRKAPCSAQAK